MIEKYFIPRPLHIPQCKPSTLPIHQPRCPGLCWPTTYGDPWPAINNKPQLQSIHHDLRSGVWLTEGKCEAKAGRTDIPLLQTPFLVLQGRLCEFQGLDYYTVQLWSAGLNISQRGFEIQAFLCWGPQGWFHRSRGLVRRENILTRYPLPKSTEGNLSFC